MDLDVRDQLTRKELCFVHMELHCTGSDMKVLYMKQLAMVCESIGCFRAPIGSVDDVIRLFRPCLPKHRQEDTCDLSHLSRLKH